MPVYDCGGDGFQVFTDPNGNSILRIDANGLSFNNAPTGPAPAVTGSLASGAALLSLIQALAARGLIVNQTTP